MTKFKVWFPTLVLVLGDLMLFTILYLWTIPGNEWLVFTIFPMMGAPYILGVAALMETYRVIVNACLSRLRI